MNDVIVAISTPPGVGGISILRLSGSNCRKIIQKNIRINNIANQNPNTIKYGHFY